MHTTDAIMLSQAMGIHRLPHGGQQPFYHVLVDERDRPGMHTTYVAQASLSLPQDVIALRTVMRLRLHFSGRCRWGVTFHVLFFAQENILSLDGDRAKEISHPQIKRAFQVPTSTSLHVMYCCMTRVLSTAAHLFWKAHTRQGERSEAL